jgi:hypothetical protein
MAISRLDPFAREFEVMIDEIASPPARAQRLAEAAQAEIDRANEINRAALGGDPRYEVTVDGRRGAPVTTVKAGGMVFAEWSFMREVLEYIGAQLVLSSPVRSGRYSQSHILLIDGNEHSGGEPPETFDNAIFASVVPYARKIERGLSRQAPEGVYEVVAAMARRRFGNVAKVQFSYRSLVGMSMLEAWAQQTTMLKVGRRRMNDSERENWLRRQPAIIVEPY